MGRTGQKDVSGRTSKNQKRNQKDSTKDKKKQPTTGGVRKEKKNSKPQKVVTEDVVDKIRKSGCSSTRKSFEDARKSGVVKLPELTVERYFHNKLINALEFYTGKRFSRKEVQLQSGVHSYLQILCNLTSLEALDIAKLFTMARNTVTTKESDIVNALQLINRHGIYGNLLKPTEMSKVNPK